MLMLYNCGSRPFWARICSMTRRASRAAFSKCGVFAVFQRHGDAGDAEKRPFDRRRDRTRIKHVDSRVQPAVDAADDQRGPAGAELEHAQFHAIGRAALDGPAAVSIVVEHFLARPTG